MQQAISYKDNDGFVVIKERAVYRYVNHSYADDYDCLIGSGLYRDLVEQGLLVAHQEDDETTDNPLYYKVLVPELIDPVSYPFEWTASQWQEMLVCFLRINLISVEYGMILKDATPFNFTFHRGRCIFFDTLSFTRYNEGDVWIAYRQFCETMFGPYSLIRYRDITWARMMQANINGWPLAFISESLPFRSKFNLAILLHIHWHAKYDNQSAGPVKTRDLSKEKLLLLWKMLLRWAEKKTDFSGEGEWTGYYEKGILSEAYLTSKMAIVRQWLDETNPVKLIDLGANNGRFSLLAASKAEKVIAVEADTDCVELLRWYIGQNDITNIETIVSDLTQPAPGLGWANSERLPLLKRLHADMVMALALIHHLCITANIPVEFVARMLADMTERYVLVEFVPQSDPKVVAMLSNRENIFSSYTEEHFIECFERYFTKCNEATCAASDRKLFLWERR